MSKSIDLKLAGERGLIGFYLKCIKSPNEPVIVREEIVYMQVLPKSGELLRTEDGNHWKVFLIVYDVRGDTALDGNSTGIPVVSAFWSEKPTFKISHSI